MEVYNVVLAGVGGQGIITVGKIIVDAALREGKNAVMSEVHGMAQRGGSVLSEVRIGDAMSSIIPSGEADLVIGFELIEPLRYVEKFGERTILLVNNDRIMPLPTLLGEEEYPPSEVIVSEMKKLTKRLYVINASKLAEEAGSPLSMNMVMLGAALSLGMPLKPETVKEVLRERFRGKVLEINEKALDLGFSTVEKMLKSVD
ncbi:MAG: indolepyruvate oxidoreductase subunit beta [Euryarchaeota archaeon]|nr:indolepyruvate oxidoreductase subunit beta [Euryarchaeota archaeon]MCD6158578.1 indolepyruvate oxidoreductase subunit beta [Euryarchaeota archaeon]